MRSGLTTLPAIGFSLVVIAGGTAAAQTPASSGVSISATFGSRTSLHVSTQTLKFDVTDPSAAAVASVDFTAAARTAADAPVVLSVEPIHGIEGAGSPGDGEINLTFEGQGDGSLASVVSRDRPTLVGQWKGSGYRLGRLVFRLRAAAAGEYTLRVRFVLSTP